MDLSGQLAGLTDGAVRLRPGASTTEPANVASAQVLARCGFRQEGRLRSFLALRRRRADALVFSLLPSDLP